MEPLNYTAVCKMKFQCSILVKRKHNMPMMLVVAHIKRPPQPPTMSRSFQKVWRVGRDDTSTGHYIKHCWLLCAFHFKCHVTYSHTYTNWDNTKSYITSMFSLLNIAWQLYTTWMLWWKFINWVIENILLRTRYYFLSSLYSLLSSKSNHSMAEEKSR